MQNNSNDVIRSVLCGPAWLWVIVEPFSELCLSVRWLGAMILGHESFPCSAHKFEHAGVNGGCYNSGLGPFVTMQFTSGWNGAGRKCRRLRGRRTFLLRLCGCLEPTRIWSSTASAKCAWLCKITSLFLSLLVTRRTPAAFNTPFLNCGLRLIVDNSI